MPGIRHDLATALAYAVLFLGGGAAGLGLAAVLAPGSWAAQVVGLFALPVAFAVGLQMWLGLALLGLVPRLFGRPPAPSPAPAGSFVFLPLSSASGAVAGTAVGFLSTAHPFWHALLIFWSAGTIHGVLAWRLARAGYLLPPERG